MKKKYYEFYNPVKIMSGEATLESISYELKQMGAKRPIVITDKGVVKAGLMKHIKKALGGTNTTIGALYDDTPIDSSSHVVNEVADIFRKKKCDSIIAVGGGSVIDTAKGVNIMVSEDTDDLMKFLGINRLTKPPKPFIVIPTTAGTGSEVTIAAVIRNPDKGVKMNFVSPLLLPNVTMLDPRMTMTMPASITAGSGMDALTHAIEAYIDIQKNPVSDAHAVAAISLIRDNLMTVVKNGRDKNARMAMANAALLAGAAFSNSMCGVVHAMAHSVGGECHVPHGLANAILLPHGMKYNLKKCKEEIGELLLPLVGEEACLAVPKKKRAQAAIDAVHKLNADLNKAAKMPITLKDAGVTEDKLEKIAKMTLDDGALQYNPVDVQVKDALAILKAAF